MGLGRVYDTESFPRSVELVTWLNLCNNLYYKPKPGISKGFE